jgi:hypothetical protein
VPLVPTKWTVGRISNTGDPDYFCQSIGGHVVECGYHVDPATGRETLIDKTSTTTSWYGRILHQEIERWLYDVPGGPPAEYKREVYGRCYLPGVNPGRRLMKLEEETRIFYPWSTFQPGAANLSSVRRLAGWVVYTKNLQRTGNLDAEAKAKLEENELNPEGPAELVVDSAQTWREAYGDSAIVQKTEAPQITRWVDPIETETEFVFEYVDRFDKYRERVVHIRPGPPEREGPEVIRKESYRYRLPVPILAPTIEAEDADDDGIRIEVEGGGATYQDREIPPERYKILRRVVSEPARTPSGDPFGIWKNEPPAVTPRTVLNTRGVTDLTGVPATSLPAKLNYTEPGDTSEPTPEGWVVVAEVDNQAPDDAPGRAVAHDTEVVNTGEYEYVAIAIIGSDESPPAAPPARVTFGGATSASSITVRPRRDPDGTLELDVVAPDDPALPEYGETVDYVVPTTDPAPEELAEEIARRQFVASRQSRSTVAVDLTAAPIYLERGQRVATPSIVWRTTGNALQIEAEVENAEWILDGYELRARTSSTGELLEVTRSTLTLAEP